MTLIVYGHPASQPSRTVYWACLLGRLPFELGDPSAGPANTNPRGQVPWIMEDGFELTEMAAIVVYLADRHGWDDLYPADLKSRARINQFLHMHHSLVRLATFHLMAPHVMKPLQLPPRTPNPYSISQRDLVAHSFSTDNPLQEGQRIVATISEFLEQHCFADGSRFICNTDHATVADLVCYSELGQFTFANLFDFQPYERISRWLDAMASVPHHDTIHAYNIQLGDIATEPNTNERFFAASEAGFQALRETGLVTS